MPPAIGGEAVPVLPPLETAGEQSSERREQVAEAGAVASNLAGSGVAVDQVTPSIPTAPLANGSAQGVVMGPSFAADEDLIEKEWVDKSKEIIALTRNDPHDRTDKVNQLQRDYLKKRFGKDLGAET